MLFHANTAAWLRARREYKGTGKAGDSRPDAGAAPAVPPSAEAGDATRLRVVVPVDGSRDAERAVRHVIGHLAAEGPIEVYLVNVQEPICAWQVKKFLLPEEIAHWQRMRAEDALAPARALLEQAGVPHHTHAAIGSPAEAILRHAQKTGCARIVVGISGNGRFRQLLYPGLAAQLVRKSRIPVTLVRP